MDSKIKWGSAFCVAVLCLGVYVDNKSTVAIDVTNIDSLSYNSLLKNANNSDVVAQYSLGQYYLHGDTRKNIPLNKDKARAWLKKAADHKHPPSAFEYARLIAHSNSKEAQQYYDIAIAGGVTAAIFEQSKLKLSDATSASVHEGLALLAYAAVTAKDPLAQAYLAVLQYEGAGIKQDRVQAVLSMQNAAAIAPTPATKKDWETKQKAWLESLTKKEQEELNERLMMGQVSNTDMLPDEKILDPSISELTPDLPANKPKPVGK